MNLWLFYESNVHDELILLKEYLERVDPDRHLGLDEQCISGYWLSKTFRTFRK